MVGEMENKQPARGSSSVERFMEGVRRCKYRPCSAEFRPKRKDHVFHVPGCKTKYTMAAYEKGIKQMERGKIHAAQIDTSPRLQRVLEVLLDGTPHTTREIIRTADVCCVNTIISELRDNGLDIVCAPVKGKRAVYQYTLGGLI